MMKTGILKSVTLCLIIFGLSSIIRAQEKKATSKTGIGTVTSWDVTDPFYPKYHLAAPFGWMNDPHPVYFKGAYHLFYQFSYVRDNPYGRTGLLPGQRPMRNWGHIMSTDLVHWRHMPVVMKPETHGRANDPHIFSGCVVDNNGTGTAIYTIDNKQIYIANSKDNDLATFTKYPDNPVVNDVPTGLETVGQMRDPWVWKEGNSWYMIIGSGLAGGKGAVIPLYKSSDLIHWDYQHPFYRADSSKFNFPGDAGFCECPSFFRLGNKYVLILSDKATYLVGRYENYRFVPEYRNRLDYGKIYVPQFMMDGKGRKLMLGWIRDGRNNQSWVKAGWAGSQTLPRVLTMSPDGSLNYEPAEELKALRSDQKSFSDIRISGSEFKILDNIKGMQFEISATFEPGKAKNFGMEFLDGESTAKLVYDVATKTLQFNDISAPLDLKGGNLNLRVFIDGETIEVYANKKVCITNAIQPSTPEGFRIKLFSADGQAVVRKIDIWKMGTIWGN